MRTGTVSLLLATMLSLLQPAIAPDIDEGSDGDNPKLYAASGRRLLATSAVPAYVLVTPVSPVIRADSGQLALQATHDGMAGLIERRWTAEDDGATVGVSAATVGDHGEGAVVVAGRREPHRQEVLAQLLGLALDHCRERGDLKVAVTAPMPAVDMQRVAAEHGFVLGRHRHKADVPFTEFYANLYWQPRRKA